MILIGIVTTLGFEARTLGDAPCFVVRRCGPAGVGDAVEDLAGNGIRVIVSWGTAGALSSRYRAGHLCVPDRILGPRGNSVPTDPGWRDRFRRKLDDCCPVGSGTLLQSARIIPASGEKNRLARDSGAGVVDMESGSIGEACMELGLPFIAIRAVLDELGDRLPAAVTAHFGADGSIRTAALLGSVVRHPGEWTALLRLGRRYGRARTALRKAARALARCADGPP